MFRTRHLDGTFIPAGDDFHVNLHLFTRIHQIIDHFRAVFSQFEAIGFGPSRNRATLNSVEEQPAPYLRLDAIQSGITSLEVQFRSPTELKYRGAVLHEPHFPALWNNICQRIGALSMLYSQTPLALDFASLREAAGHVRLVHHELHHLKKSRRSTHTGQLHPLGGFIGTARYEGNLDPFLPYLQAAEWTGVGRHTVWGKGEIALSFPPNPKTLTAPQ